MEYKYAEYKEKDKMVKEPEKKFTNITGIPQSMKNQFESQSRYSMDEVRVHYNSLLPGEIGALSYAKGNQVYIGPGQEKYLGHELAHVIQQRSGRVKANLNIKGHAVSFVPKLERDADAMEINKEVNDRPGKEVIQMMLPINDQIVLARLLDQLESGQIKEEEIYAFLTTKERPYPADGVKGEDIRGLNGSSGILQRDNEQWLTLMSMRPKEADSIQGYVHFGTSHFTDKRITANLETQKETIDLCRALDRIHPKFYEYMKYKAEFNMIEEIGRKLDRIVIYYNSNVKGLEQYILNVLSSFKLVPEMSAFYAPIMIEDREHTGDSKPVAAYTGAEEGRTDKGSSFSEIRATMVRDAYKKYKTDHGLEQKGFLDYVEDEFLESGYSTEHPEKAYGSIEWFDELIHETKVMEEKIKRRHESEINENSRFFQEFVSFGIGLSDSILRNKSLIEGLQEAYFAVLPNMQFNKEIQSSKMVMEGFGKVIEKQKKLTLDRRGIIKGRRVEHRDIEEYVNNTITIWRKINEQYCETDKLFNNQNNCRNKYRELRNKIGE